MAFPVRLLFPLRQSHSGQLTLAQICELKNTVAQFVDSKSPHFLFNAAVS